MLKNGRSLSISSDKVDGAPKVQEVETVKTPPMEKVCCNVKLLIKGCHIHLTSACC